MVIQEQTFAVGVTTDNVTIETNEDGNLAIKDSYTDGLEHSEVKEVYTGAGFNTDAPIESGDVEASQELTAQDATSAKYVKIKITGISRVKEHTANGLGYVQLKAQIKETGEAYADIVAYKDILKLKTSSTSIHEIDKNSTYEIIKELTAGMKTNGYQIKAFSHSVSGTGDNSDARFTNIQTITEEYF